MNLVGPDAAGLEAAVAAIERGDPVVVPTDTVYGVAAKVSDLDAIDRLFELKRRPAERAIAVLVASVEQAGELGDLTEAELELAGRWWPGALTIVVRRRDEAPSWLGRDDGTLGLRCPDERFLRDLAQRVGPLATTSANLSGEATPTEAAAAAEVLDGDVAVVVDAGPRAGSASTVVRLAGGELEILRPGPLTATDLRVPRS